MVQRKLGLQANLPNPIKGLASQLKPSSSLKEGNKKIKKSRSMKLSPSSSSPPSSSSKKHDSELPNYMKATSSSVAKQPQVSPDMKRHGSGSCNKQTRTLTKSSSLKSVRALTKSPSFKLARASSSAKKKRSGVALCADIDMQRATCSSTLKDSKFPDFLELGHGGTEAEGTSIVKVCPYLYCSLNGHHHKPSPPPLKMFLKAKRRVLKSQRSSKKIEAIEVYVKNKVVVVDDDEDEDGQVAESLSDGSPKSEVDFEEGFEEIKVEDEDEDCFGSEYEGGDEDGETQMGRFCFESDSEGEFEGSMDVDEGDSDAIGVDKGAIFSIEMDDLSYLEVGFSMESKDLDVQGGLEDEQSDDTAMEATQASEEIAVPQEGPQLEDDEASNGDELSEAALDHEQETELEAIDEVAQDDPKLEDYEACNGDEESEAALYHHHHQQQQETELEAIDEVAELISSDGALDHQQETEFEAIDEGALDHHQEAELEAIDEGALDHHQEAELEAIDEVAELITSDHKALDHHQQETESEAIDEVAELITSDHGALDHHHHHQETESEAIDEVAEPISSDGAMDHHHQETESEAIDVVAELITSDHGALDHHRQEIELEAIDEVAEPISSDGALDHQQETESEAKHEVAEPISSDGAMDHQQETESEAQKLKGGFARAQSTKESHPNTDSNTKWSIGRKRSTEEDEEEGQFNPREPTFLPLIPDPEAEKVDLRHQIIDERKNSDEWMLDYALQRTLTKLAPARKRKVALLVEAFESVLPVPRYHHQPPAAAFAHARPIQACN